MMVFAVLMEVSVVKMEVCENEVIPINVSNCQKLGSTMFVVFGR